MVRIVRGALAARWKQLALSACTTLVLLLVIELAFRLLGVTGYHLPRTREWSHALVKASDRLPGVGRQFIPNSSLRSCFDSNPRGYFDADNCLTYTLNNFGFRDDDYTLDKPPGVKRVLILGDSFAFGEGVRLQQTFPVLLENHLVSAGLAVEVLNFSIGGWGTQDEVAYLEHAGLKFAPDLVIVAYVLNDIGPYLLDVWDGFRQQYEKRTLRHSAFLSWAYSTVVQRQYVREYVESMTRRALQDRNKWASSFAGLERGQDLSEAHGAKFAVVILPFMYDLSDDHPFLPIHRLIEEYCKSKNIPVSDVLPSLMGHRYTDLWVHASDPHPNEKGHTLIAKALMDFILRDGLLGVR